MMAAAAAFLEWVSSPAVLIGIRFFHGVFFGVNSTVGMTMASVVTPEKKMGQGLGIFTVTGVGAQSVAPAMGLAIAAQWGYPVLFICAAGISAIAAPLPLILSDKVLSRKTGAGNSAKKSGSGKKLPSLSILGFACLAMFYTGVTSSVTNFMVLYGMGKGISNIGFYFTVYALVLIAVRFFGGSLTDRFPFRRVLFPCSVCCALALLIISFAGSFTFLAVAAGFMGIGYGMAIPTIQAVSIRSVDPANHGTTVATVYGGTDLAHCFGPVVMGAVVESAGYSRGFQTMCIAMLATVPVIILLSSKRGPSPRLAANAVDTGNKTE